MKFPWQKKSTMEKVGDAALGAFAVLGTIVVAACSETPEQRANRLERELADERARRRRAERTPVYSVTRAQLRALRVEVELQLEEAERESLRAFGWRERMAADNRCATLRETLRSLRLQEAVAL